MTPLEDQLRAALRATVTTMPPGPPPPLTLPEPRRRARSRPPGLRSGRGWAVSVTADARTFVLAGRELLISGAQHGGGAEILQGERATPSRGPATSSPPPGEAAHAAPQA